MHDVRLGVFMDEGAPAVIEDSLAWLSRSSDPSAEAREPESKPRPCQSPLLRMACASASGRESIVSALKWSTISWRVGSLLQGIPGRLLPFTSTRSCSNENGRYSRCSGESMQ